MPVPPSLSAIRSRFLDAARATGQTVGYLLSDAAARCPDLAAEPTQTQGWRLLEMSNPYVLTGFEGEEFWAEFLDEMPAFAAKVLAQLGEVEAELLDFPAEIPVARVQLAAAVHAMDPEGGVAAEWCLRIALEEARASGPEAPNRRLLPDYFFDAKEVRIDPDLWMRLREMGPELPEVFAAIAQVHAAWTSTSTLTSTAPPPPSAVASLLMARLVEGRLGHWPDGAAILRELRVASELEIALHADEPFLACLRDTVAALGSADDSCLIADAVHLACRLQPSWPVLPDVIVALLNGVPTDVTDVTDVTDATDADDADAMTELPVMILGDELLQLTEGQSEMAQAAIAALQAHRHPEVIDVVVSLRAQLGGSPPPGDA